MGEIRVDLSTVQAVSDFTSQPTRRGLAFSRYFTRDIESGKTPYDLIDWEKRSSSITNVKGEVVFEQHDIETPRGWSQTATNIVASKYFHGTVGEADSAPGAPFGSRSRRAGRGQPVRIHRLSDATFGLELIAGAARTASIGAL